LIFGKLVHLWSEGLIKYGNDFLSLQETDCIVNQMMNVAEYLGWDVSELKPVSLLIDLYTFSTC
jgi:hypothetical protein